MKKTSTRLADGRELHLLRLRATTSCATRSTSGRSTARPPPPRSAATRCSATGRHRLAPAGPHLPPAGRRVPALPVRGTAGSARSPPPTTTSPSSRTASPPLGRRLPGRCEVVCFTSDHDASFADLTEEQAAPGPRRLDRPHRRAVRNCPRVEQVFCFENRGAEIGVTLGHPHGQIYAYPFTTPRTALHAALGRRHTRRAPAAQPLRRRPRRRTAPTARAWSWRASTGSPSCRTPRTGRTRCTSTRGAGCRTCSALDEDGAHRVPTDLSGTA